MPSVSPRRACRHAGRSRRREQSGSSKPELSPGLLCPKDFWSSLPGTNKLFAATIQGGNAWRLGTPHGASLRAAMRLRECPVRRHAILEVKEGVPDASRRSAMISAAQSLFAPGSKPDFRLLSEAMKQFAEVAVRAVCLASSFGLGSHLASRPPCNRAS